MAVKTITIDVEAYELLASQKQEGESFSQVIKRRFRTRPAFDEILRTIRASNISDRTLNRIESISKDLRKEKIGPGR